MKIRKIGKREDAAHGQYHVVITISNVILCAIAVICMLTVMFTWFQNYMQEEITKLSYTQLGNTVQSTENRLDYYQMQLQNLFQEPQIKASLYTNEEGPIHEFNIYRFLNYSIVNDQIIDYALIYKDNKIKQFVGTVYPGEEELDTIVEYLNQSQNDMEIYQYYNEKAKTSRLYLFRTERDVLNGPPKRGLLFAVNQEKLAKYVLFGDFETISCAVDYSEKVDEEIPKKSLEKLVSVVKSGNDVEAKSLMPGILNSVSQYEIKRIFCALSYLAAEIEQVYDQFSSRAREYQGLYLEHYIKLTSLVNQKELYDYFSNIIEDACLEMRTSNERSLRTTMLDSIRYIEEHYTDPDLSVDKIATIFHISNSYFSRMFHEICNLSFPEYVNELRLNYSAQLLQTTNLNVKEIAARSGFSGVSYFGAQFKKKYGVSPSVFRGKQASKV